MARSASGTTRRRSIDVLSVTCRAQARRERAIFSRAGADGGQAEHCALQRPGPEHAAIDRHDQAGDTQPDGDDEIDVDDEALGADEAEAEDVDGLAVVSRGHDAEHPDQGADHDDGEGQLEHGPGDGGEEDPLGLLRAAVMGFEPAEDFAERAGLFADADHFEKQRREHAAGAGQRQGHALSLSDGVAHLGHVRAQPAGGGVGLALPRATDVDAGVGLDGQAVAELGEGLVRESRLEEHGKSSVVSGQLSVVHWLQFMVSTKR